MEGSVAHGGEAGLFDLAVGEVEGDVEHDRVVDAELVVGPCGAFESG